MADISALITGVKNFFKSSNPTVASSSSSGTQRGNIPGDAPKENFYDRVKGESSTSRYIQANTTDKDGKPKGQTERITRTPADRVQVPQLRNDTQKLELMEENSSAKSSGIPMPIIITNKDTKISEPQPTDDKAKYGKIQIKENSAGFVEIRDETPGNVRKIDLHPTGTYDAMFHNGDVHQKVCGKKFTYVDSDWNIMIFGDEISVISGSETVHIKKDRVENVNGKKTLNVDGDSFSKVGGDHTQEVVKDYSFRIGGNEGRRISSSPIRATVTSRR